MNHITNSKHRKIRHAIRSIFDKLSFNFLNFRFHQKVVLLGVLVATIALFLSWFSVGQDITGRAFSGTSGYVGYVTMILFGILLFSLFSSRTKMEIKSKSGIHFTDHSIAIFIGLFAALLDISIFASICSLSLFSKDVLIGNGPSLFFVGSLCILFGGVLGYRSYKMEILDTYIENNRITSEMLEEYDSILAKNEPDKKNMSLPV